VVELANAAHDQIGRNADARMHLADHALASDDVLEISVDAGLEDFDQPCLHRRVQP